MDGVEVGPDVAGSDLVDVTRLPLDDLLAARDTVLSNALRRLLAELDQPQEIIAAFDSYIGDPAAAPARPSSRG